MKILLAMAVGVMAALGKASELLDEFSLQNEQFSTSVYKEMLKLNSTNFLVCPLSVRIILALTYIGARGNTSKELAAGLKIPDDKAKVKEIAHELTPYLRVDGNYTLTSSNKIYVADRFKLSDQFKSTALGDFDSDIQNIDFAKNIEAAAEMNRWVEERTYNKIRGLIQPSLLDANTVAVLINAVYFKGDWTNPFDSEFTQKRKFFVGNERKVDVDMMLTDYYFNYHYCSDLKAQFLQLPYVGDDVVMTVVLPDANDGLAALEARIGEVFANRKYDLTEINVSFPKFKIETTIDFKKILMELGITEAFKEGAADFGEMNADGQSIFITEVAQKTFIEVTEKGTTAGAASAVVIGDRIFSGSFVADHPFLFFLRHKTAGIFFVGRFAAPEAVTPDVAIPEAVVPEVSTPEIAVPEITTPKVDVPETTTLEIAVPETTTPKVAVPETTTLEIAVPETTTPKVAVPETTTPEMAVSETTTPSISTPEFSIQNNTVPGGAATAASEKDSPVIAAEEAPVVVNNSPKITIFMNNNPEVASPPITILVNNTPDFADPRSNIQELLILENDEFTGDDSENDSTNDTDLNIA